MISNDIIAPASSSVTPSGLFYNDTYEKKQWYLDGSTASALSIDVYSVWKEYNGAGVKIGVIDSQIDFRHQDLAKAYDQSLDYNFAQATAQVTIDPKNLPYYHGTAVAGVISAEAGNAFGTVGIASGATLVGLGVDYSSPNVESDILAALTAASKVDIANNSWSFSTNFEDDFRKNPAYQSTLVHAVSEGRGGLGTSLVFAAGNAGTTGSSNYHNFQNSPYTIAVGAVDPDGKPSSFTSLGSNVLLSAAGTAVFTTTLNDHFDEASGTSFAAPAVSAAVGLMLQANPALGYRDVQQILAYSAHREGLSDAANFGDGWRTNGASTFNGGGLHYSDAFGYGFLNVHDAVRLAETWTGQQTYANLQTATKTVAVNQKLVAGSRDHISVDIPITQSIKADHVQLAMDLKWVQTGDLDVYLVSPEGTQVRLVYDLPGEDKVGSIRNFTFDSVASIGELSAGTWKLEIYNRNPGAADKAGAPLTGSLAGVTLTVTGSAASPNDTYVYTDEFGSLYSGADLAGRKILDDKTGGIDAINAAAVTSDCTIDLSCASKTVIAGVTLALTPNTIENACGGDGNDTLIGSKVANVLNGGRGDDLLYFSFGSDRIDGGQGQDKLVVNGSFGSIVVHADAGGAITISAHAGEVSTVTNVESFVFTDATYSYDQMLHLLAPPSGAAHDAAAAPATPPTGTFDETARDYARTFNGSDGADKMVGTDGADLIDGRNGNDTLSGDKGDDALYGRVGDDRLSGGDGHDFIDGGAGNDRIAGDLGNDKLLGGFGDDIIKGGAGDDWIVGGAGSDRLYGEAGADTFVFDVSDLDGLDTIYDFDAAEGDRIVVTGASGTSATFDFVKQGGATVLELHVDGSTYDIARIKGDGLDTLTMSASDLGLIWA